MGKCISPYELSRDEKNVYFLDKINKLTSYHRQHCHLYNRYLITMDIRDQEAKNLSDVPYLPARAFKSVNLSSVQSSQVRSTVISSGTSGVQSKVNLDARTQLKQSLILKEILTSFIGNERLPLLIIDSPSAGKMSREFSARTAGILGFSIVASHVCYALNEEMELEYENVLNFLSQYGDSKFLIFGFTYIIWQYLIQWLNNSRLELALKQGVIFHGGGWKKLASLNISNELFKATIKELTEVSHVHNYYGMVEQTGSLFVECEYGYLHASKYSEALARDEYTREPLPAGSKGVVQVFSLMPESYPGHSILTEDIGCVSEDTRCACGRNGSIINIEGRLDAAEIRGCSDAY